MVIEEDEKSSPLTNGIDGEVCDGVMAVTSDPQKDESIQRCNHQEEIKPHLTPHDIAEKEDVERSTDSNRLETTKSFDSQLPFSRFHSIALVIVLTGAAFLNTLSVQICVIILPTIGKDLDIPAARQQWIVSSYSLTFGCFLLLWGRLADVYGKKLIFVYGSAWVAVVTLICPFVSNEIGFNVFRGLQGLGAAANVPTAIGILGVTFPPGKAKAYAFATYSSGAPLGSVFGNLLGGLVGQYASWKWAFWILAILAAIVTITGCFVVPAPQSSQRAAKTKHAIDWPGGVLITIGLVVLLFALTEGNVVGWGKAYIPVLIVISIIMVVIFVLWQVHLEKKMIRRPLMKMSIFKNLRVSAAMLVMAFFFAGFNNFLIFATYYFQDYQGHDAIETTIRFLPTGVVGLMTVFVTSQMLARINVIFIVMFGTLSTTVSSLLFAVPISPSETYWAYAFPAMCLSVFGADTVFPSLLLFVAQCLPKEDQAIGGAFINAVGQIGRAVGLAIATAIQVAVQQSKSATQNAAVQYSGTQDNFDFLEGLRAAEWFNVALGLAAFCIGAIAFKGAGKVGVAAK